MQRVFSEFVAAAETMSIQVAKRQERDMSRK
jgi:hypothetical protein